MITLVIYDISDNKLRKSVETVCRDIGVHRVQKSAFRGEIALEKHQRLRDNLTALLENTRRTDVQVYRISEDDFAGHLRLTNGAPAADGEAAPEFIIV